MTQTEWVRDQLDAGRRLTPLDALRECGIMRLGARVWDLRQGGYPVEERLVEVGGGKRVAEYRRGETPAASTPDRGCRTCAFAIWPARLGIWGECQAVAWNADSRRAGRGGRAMRGSGAYCPAWKAKGEER